MPELDAIHLSDLHLGSSLSQAGKILYFLDNLPPTKRLILGGDVLEDTQIRLRKKHWQVLSKLRKLSDDLELVWVKGNHDFDADSAAHLIGANFCDEYLYRSGDKLVLTVHGDEWDDFIRDYPLTTLVADWAYLFLQRFAPRWARLAKSNSKTFLRCAAKVREGARKVARRTGSQVVVCGHTHHHEEPGGFSPKPGQAVYYNTGCWTEDVCHYLTVADEKFLLHPFESKNAIA